MKNNVLVPELLSIGQLFTAKYLVPVYQRNYAWRVEQIEQLISDVHDAMLADDDYFLGNLVVILRASGEVFEVIDGQQRLTTLYLLLTFLQEDGAESGHSSSHIGRLQYESRARATEALRLVAQDAVASSRLQGASIDADAGIHEGYGIIQQFFKQNFRLNQARAAFADFLRERVTVVRASLPLNTDLNRYFEIMNTRGQQLKQVDIVKARLMSKLSDQHQQACFAWIWEACADMDSYLQMSLTRGDTGLRTQVFGSDWSWLKAADFAALMQFRAKAVLQTPGQNTGGALSLEQALSRYADVGAQAAGQDDGNERFRSTIEFPVLLLHVLKVLHGDPKEDEGALDDKRLIKAFDASVKQAADKEVEWVQHFAFMLLKCRNLFDAFVLKRQFTANKLEDGDWSLQRLKKGGTEAKPSPTYSHVFARAERSQEEDGNADPHTGEVLLLQSMLRITYTSPRTMHWITQVLRWLSEQAPQEVSRVDLAEFLKRYARVKVRECFSFEREQQPQGFGISRIVFTYLDFLLLSDAAKRDFKFQFRTSIEHFYPQRPDQEQSGELVAATGLHLLGNLALVSISANSKFSNSLPRAKAENFRDTIERQSPKLRLMAEITLVEGWGDSQVGAHHQHMLTLLRQDVGPE
ncbi:DUF262 domain-containing protein [Janthinobacterium sp. RB2P8]|jgi:hypothetical protein|uniref:DUF262 domain-containing protein n=1 Tax=Janthinobacterium sp. RB2P8 TaxID=3424191 RepID=UPI003F282CEF